VARRKKAFLLLGFGLTVFFLYLALRKQNLSEIWHALRAAEYGYLLPALIMFLAGYFFRTLRWQFLLNPVKSLPLGRLFPLMVIGFMANNILPSRAGEVIRAYLTGRKEGISRSATFATILVERIFDGLVLVLFLALVLIAAPLPGHLSPEKENVVQQITGAATTAGIVLFASLLVLLAAISWREKSTAILIRIIGYLPERARGLAEHLVHSVMNGLESLRRAKDAFFIFVTSVLSWAFEAASYYYVLLAFGLHVGAIIPIMLLSVVNLATMVPSTPGYFGPFEYFGAGTLKFFGAEPETALACIIVIHALVYLPITILGAIFVGRAGLTWKELSAQPAGKAAP
jgi:glycosyltransferase 2 family protein